MVNDKLFSSPRWSMEMRTKCWSMEMRTKCWSMKIRTKAYMKPKAQKSIFKKITLSVKHGHENNHLRLL